MPMSERHKPPHIPSRNKEAKGWGSSQLLLDFLEGFSSSSSPFELFFLKAFNNWGGTKTSDKSLIKSG